MIINDEEFGYVHIYTGGKEFSDEEIEEIKEWFRSKELEEMIEKSKESHKRVIESKITDKTKI
ncbi:hypothetical protein P1A29_02095 [Staphylococcus equorum]|uniref:hypothetical protein n=1 Tax=Staphylococcus equorum TaxID=246432 RepID=UPI00255526A8|nr:hypothetical protein [Staphylococcus equorum]MDK9859231.1 hypothetical protein [Staphylococcus equorum]